MHRLVPTDVRDRLFFFQLFFDGVFLSLFGLGDHTKNIDKGDYNFRIKNLKGKVPCNIFYELLQKTIIEGNFDYFIYIKSVWTCSKRSPKKFALYTILSFSVILYWCWNQLILCQFFFYFYLFNFYRCRLFKFFWRVKNPRAV